MFVDTDNVTGVSPSGKAAGFDPAIRWFESSHPSHLILLSAAHFHSNLIPKLVLQGELRA